MSEPMTEADKWKSVADEYRAIIEAIAPWAPNVVAKIMQQRGFGHTDLATNLDAIEVNRTKVTS